MCACARAQWAPDDRQLASGGNDNAVAVWAAGGGAEAGPVFRDTSHCAAVKALAWSPHQHGLLATGGGTSDRHIRRAVQPARNKCELLLVSSFCRKESLICTSEHCFSLIDKWLQLLSPEHATSFSAEAEYDTHFSAGSFTKGDLEVRQGVEHKHGDGSKCGGHAQPGLRACMEPQRQ